MDTFDFLRSKARQCRDFARYHEGDAAEGLCRMAAELDAKADEIEGKLAGLVRLLHPGSAAPRH